MPRTKQSRGPFARAVDGMPEFGQPRGTWLRDGGWSEREFTERSSVPADRLVATNRGGHLDEALVARYARRWFPPRIWVVERGGWFYIGDGHHTAAAAIANGKRRIPARVKRL